VRKDQRPRLAAMRVVSCQDESLRPGGVGVGLVLLRIHPGRRQMFVVSLGPNEEKTQRTEAADRLRVSGSLLARINERSGVGHPVSSS
jgi:hypothetical protein